MYTGTHSGNVWRQSRLLVSAVFASVVAFLWVDAFRELREWAVYYFSGVNKLRTTALLAIIFAIVGVSVALLVIMMLLRCDNEELTSMSELLKVSVDSKSGNILQTSQLVFEHAGTVKLIAKGTFHSSAISNLKAEIIANDKVLWVIPLHIDAYEHGGTFSITRSIPTSGEVTTVQLKLYGFADSPVDVSVEADVTLVDGLISDVSDK